jgi:hypothetical protein
MWGSNKVPMTASDITFMVCPEQFREPEKYNTEQKAFDVRAWDPNLAQIACEVHATQVY